MSCDAKLSAELNQCGLIENPVKKVAIERAMRPEKLFAVKVLYSPKKMTLEQKHRAIKNEMDYFLSNNPGYAFEKLEPLKDEYGTEPYRLHFKRAD